VALELLHELLVERPEVDHLLLERRGVGLLLLPVLPDGGAVPRGALLGGGVAVTGGVGVVLGRRLGGVVAGRGGDDLGVDVDAGVGVREVVHGRVAGVGVRARVVLRVLEDLVEVAVHGAAAGRVGAERRAQVRVRVGEIQVPVVHCCCKKAGGRALGSQGLIHLGT